jgi:hypothetical protein
MAIVPCEVKYSFVKEILDAVSWNMAYRANADKPAPVKTVVQVHVERNYSEKGGQG